MNDREAMARAIELAAGGFPAPNPHVGCVLVKDGKIVGEGFHTHAGAPHAEAMALIAAGEAAKGATAYVTLEPCKHQGRTPPCSLALIRAGVIRVVIAVPDLNPKAQGGADRLRQEGIEVETGLMNEEAVAVNRQFLFAMRHHRPLVTLKIAMSLDGRIALPSGESKWITGEETRAEGHRLRAERGAVLVGRRTITTDNSQLTARIPGVVNQPTRVVLDPRRKLGGNENVFDDSAPTIRVVAPEFARPSDVVIPCADDEFDLNMLLSNLFDRGITGLLVEGGATTLGHFVAQNLWDELVAFVAPKILLAGPSWAEGFAPESMDAVVRHEFVEAKKLDGDLCIVMRRRT